MRTRILTCSFALAVCMAIGAQTATAQSLVYMLSYGNTPASLRARFPNGILGTTPQQRVATTRQTLKTEIWSISLQDGKRTLLFSDEDMGLEIRPIVGGHTVDSTRNVAYVDGVERTWEAPPKLATPGVYETSKGVYEVSLDGSKHFQRLFNATQNMSAAMLNAAGTRAAFYGWEDKGGYFLYVYELPSGKLLTRANTVRIFQTHCGSCLPQQAGWLAGGKELFFVLQEGDDDDSADEAQSGGPGTCLLSEQGTDLGAMPAHAGEMNLPDYKREPSTAPYLIAQMEDGSYLFLDSGLKKGPLPKASIHFDGFLVLAGPDFKVQKQIRLGSLRASEFQLSRDGTWLAYVENRELPTYTTERHFWVRNLQTGEEKEILIVPTANPPNSPEPKASVVLLGWIGETK